MDIQGPPPGGEGGKGEENIQVRAESRAPSERSARARFNGEKKYRTPRAFRNKNLSEQSENLSRLSPFAYHLALTGGAGARKS